MSDTDSQEEPSMEEILASIRKIISEDDEGVEEPEAVEPEPATESEPEPEPEPEIMPEVEEDISLEEDEDVLELTEAVEEEAEEDVEIIEEPEADPVFEPEAEPISVIAIDDVDPATEDEVLMSGEPSSFAMDQFGMLSDLLTSGYEGSGNTLEDLVREMLKPMLQGWLDKNLPPLVERMVAKEIARLSRTKKP